MTHDVNGAVFSDELTANRLLSALPAEELDLLRPLATLVPLNRRDVLFGSRRHIENVFFPIDGIASVLSVMADGSGVETATIGREGMVGLPVFHGVFMTPEQALVQVPGRAYRIEADAFTELLPHTPELTRLLHRFSVVMFSLAAQNSGCNRKHSIEERCCRWLLMVADRLDRAQFELTHDFVAQMLGVRRASVTESLGALEKSGLLETGRGRIRIVDRTGLEARSCECYGVIREVVERLLDRQATSDPLDGMTTEVGGKSVVGAPFN